MEEPAAGWCCGGVGQRRGSGGAGSGLEDAARQDRGVGAGERFFVRRARQGRPAERKAMIDSSHDLPVTRQAKLLSISRGSVYYKAWASSPKGSNLDNRPARTSRPEAPAGGHLLQSKCSG